MEGSLSVELATRTKSLERTEAVLFVVINVMAFFGNLLTCYAVYRNQRLRTLPNIFVIALCVSDILMSTLCMPYTVVTLFHGRWMFGESFCRFHGFGALTFRLISLQTMGLIAVSRYNCVVKPEKYALLFKKQRASLYIAVVWCAALIGSVPPFFFKNGGFEFQPGKAMCLYTFETNIPYTVFIECVYIAAPLTIITICYTKVFYTASRSNKVFSHENNHHRLRANVEEAKVTKTLAAVMVGFTCCWLPISIMDNIDAARGELTLPRQAYLTYVFLAYLSSAINPFIYGVTSRQFRREYKAILRMTACFRKQHNNNNNTTTNNNNDNNNGTNSIINNNNNDNNFNNNNNNNNNNNDNNNNNNDDNNNSTNSIINNNNNDNNFNNNNNNNDNNNNNNNDNNNNNNDNNSTNSIINNNNNDNNFNNNNNNNNNDNNNSTNSIINNNNIDNNFNSNNNNNNNNHS